MSNPAKSRKVAAVTGATGSIGQAIVAGLVELDYQVVLLIRNQMKAENLVSQIRKTNPDASVIYRIVDLSDQTSIISLAKSWNMPLHLLINNAAIAPPARQETKAGIELQFATNVLGYYWMTKYFSDILNHSTPARVVNIASYWAGGLDFSDLEFKKRLYDNHLAYRQSKQANRMLTPISAEQFNPEHVTINCCHPGDVNSALSNDLGFGGSQTPAEGAQTPLWLATSRSAAGLTGSYFESQRKANCPFGAKRMDGERLLKICQAY